MPLGAGFISYGLGLIAIAILEGLILERRKHLPLMSAVLQTSEFGCVEKFEFLLLAGHINRLLSQERELLQKLPTMTAAIASSRTTTRESLFPSW